MKNLITDVPGVQVGNAQNAALASGVTALIFDAPAVASIAIHGGAPGTRDCALLEPDKTVERVDALVLSGGSAFGLDSMGGVMAHLAQIGRGFAVHTARVPIVPGAILFDLLNGGNKAWGLRPPYWDLGLQAAQNASSDFKLGTAGAGFGALTVNLKGGLGSASCKSSNGYTIGALVAVNAFGQATIGDSAHFWASAFEQNGEFGGLLPYSELPANALSIRLKGLTPQNTTIAIVATDAHMTKAQAKRLAVQAHDGMAIALRPAHAALDGDLIFAASTLAHPRAPELFDLTEIGALAADCLARAIARGIYEATALPFAGALPAYRDKFRTDLPHRAQGS